MVWLGLVLLAAASAFVVGWTTARVVQAREDAAVIAAGDALARLVRQLEVVQIAPRGGFDGDMLVAGGKTWQGRAGQALAMWEGLNEERGKRV